MDKVRQEIVFSGRVQGVGFRYTARQVAQRYQITGWVKNLVNGTVQIMVEGKPDEINRYLDDVTATINTSSYGMVESAVRKEFETATGEFASFFVA